MNNLQKVINVIGKYSKQSVYHISNNNDICIELSHNKIFFVLTKNDFIDGNDSKLLNLKSATIFNPSIKHLLDFKLKDLDNYSIFSKCENKISKHVDCLSIINNHLFISNGYRLFLKPLNNISKIENMRVSIDIIKYAKKLFSKKDILRFGIDENSHNFIIEGSNNIKIIGNIINNQDVFYSELDFMNYITNETTNKLLIDGKEFKNAINKISKIHSKDSMAIVRFRRAKNSLEFLSNTPTYYENCSVECDFNSDNHIDYTFRIKYINDCLKLIKDKFILIKFQNKIMIINDNYIIAKMGK